MAAIDDVAARDVAHGSGKRRRIAAPFVGGVHAPVRGPGSRAAAPLARAPPRRTGGCPWSRRRRAPACASAAEMRFGIVQRLDGDGRQRRVPAAKRSVLRRALPRTKNGILPQLLLGVRVPGDRLRRPHRRLRGFGGLQPARARRLRQDAKARRHR